MRDRRRRHRRGSGRAGCAIAVAPAPAASGERRHSATGCQVGVRLARSAARTPAEAWGALATGLPGPPLYWIVHRRRRRCGDRAGRRSRVGVAPRRRSERTPPVRAAHRGPRSPARRRRAAGHPRAASTDRADAARPDAATRAAAGHRGPGPSPAERAARPAGKATVDRSP